MIISLSVVSKHVQVLEDMVLQLWTKRKKRFDQCQQYTLVERSAKQSLLWIQETGEGYLLTHTTVGKTQTETEALLSEHKDFSCKAKVSEYQLIYRRNTRSAA